MQPEVLLSWLISLGITTMYGLWMHYRGRLACSKFMVHVLTTERGMSLDQINAMVQSALTKMNNPDQ